METRHPVEVVNFRRSLLSYYVVKSQDLKFCDEFLRLENNACAYRVQNLPAHNVPDIIQIGSGQSSRSV